MSQAEDEKPKTASEELFEEFCRVVKIPFERIAEEHDPRPDYEVELGGSRVIVEVKQFDPNAEEAESNRRRAAGERSGVKVEPGDRIRKAIHRAAPQLKALSKGARPAMLVVYNNSGASQHTDEYSVSTAMLGLDVVPVVVPADPSVSPEFLDARSGPKRKMTPDDNTTISAIAVLRTALDDEPFLCIYHNRHAVNPIEPDWLRAEPVFHFRVPEGATSSLAGWTKA